MEAQATAVVEVAAEYVGRWNRLISTTNWEKGRIICEWRAALQQADASPGAYADEAWSRQVGGVSPQHVGRLRRVFERFGASHEEYPGLYWSHFQAALDWPDAEMYLEGAVQNDWSVSEMRHQRWEVLGGNPELEPHEEDIIASEVDEDCSAADDERLPAAISESVGEVHRADDYSDLDERADAAPFDAGESQSGEAASAAVNVPAASLLRPFEALPPLPADLSEAFELMKLSILGHKVSGWREIACDDVLSVIESLRQLALAPAE